MGWIESYRKRERLEEGQGSDFLLAAQSRWLELGEELKADVAEFSTQHEGADFSATGENQFHVRYAKSGLKLAIVADFDARVIRYDYSPTGNSSAGVPEGGMLSMRQSRRGTVEFYSADERLTSEETREILLQPVLFPPQLAV